MNLFNLFKHKPKPAVKHSYHPAMTADCKAVLSTPIIPDWQTKLSPEEMDDYPVEISEDRRN
jgi:hypothetical protein